MRMKSYRILFCCAVLVTALIMGLQASAQDILTAHLSWEVNRLIDQNTQQASSYSCTFETNGRSAVLWKQKGGAVVTSIDITSVTGSWADVKAAGQVIFEIEVEGEPGTLVFERAATGAFISLKLGDSYSIDHRYVVSSITAK